MSSCSSIFTNWALVRKSRWVLVAGGVRAHSGAIPEQTVHPRQEFYSQQLLERLPDGHYSFLWRDTGDSLWGQRSSNDHPLPFQQLTGCVFSKQPDTHITPWLGAQSPCAFNTSSQRRALQIPSKDSGKLLVLVDYDYL